MTFYLSKLWFWWLLAIVLAAILTAWLCRRLSRPRKPVVDERHVRELVDARAAASRHEAKVNELLSLRARELDELTAVRAQLGRADELQGRLRALEVEAGAVPSLEAEVRTLRVEADRVRPLQDETAALRRQIGDLTADNNRLAPLQARLQDLEAEASEAAALRRRVGELEEGAASLGFLQARVTELEGASAELAALRGRLADADVEAARGRDAQAEVQGLRGRVRELEARATSAGDRMHAFADQPPEPATDGAPAGLLARIAALEGELAAERAGRPADTSGARAVLGRTVKADDLKVVEGIGPKIDELLRADGITTWRELADAPVERLRGVLDAAGPRFQIHDPGTWPEQAALLVASRWADFKTLTDQLKGGRG